MGTWGAGPFDNDTALDFAARIQTLSDVEQALEAAEERGEALITDEIDAELSCEILVAGECVAAMRGHPSADLPPELAQTVLGFGAPSVEVFSRARANVSAVMSYARPDHQHR